MTIANTQEQSLSTYIRNGVVGATKYAQNGLTIAGNQIARSENLPSKILSVATGAFAVYGVTVATWGQGKLTKAAGFLGAVLSAGAVATKLFQQAHTIQALEAQIANQQPSQRQQPTVEEVMSDDDTSPQSIASERPAARAADNGQRQEAHKAPTTRQEKRPRWRL